MAIKNICLLWCITIIVSFTLSAQDKIEFFNKLINKGFYTLAEEWLTEEINNPENQESNYLNQLKILLEDVKFNPLFNLPKKDQLKEFISYFSTSSKDVFSMLTNKSDGLQQIISIWIEPFFIRLLRFLEYYEASLIPYAKNDLQLQNSLAEMMAKIVQSAEDGLKNAQLEEEPKAAIQYYTIITKFYNLKLFQTNETSFKEKFTKLDEEMENFYLNFQPSVSAYEIWLLRGELYKIRLEKLIAENKQEGIKSNISKIESFCNEIYSQKEKIPDIKQITPDLLPTARLVLKAAILKLDVGILRLSNNIYKDVNEKNNIYNECMEVIKYIGPFPDNYVKTLIEFKRAQLLELGGKIEEALPLYSKIAKSPFPISTQAIEILKRYQQNITISAEHEIINELGRLIEAGNRQKVWDFYTLYIRKRNYFKPSYSKTLQEIIASFFALQEQYLETSIFNYYLFGLSDDENYKETKLMTAINSLQNYITFFREEGSFFTELLNSWKDDFAAKYPNSKFTQPIILSDVIAKIKQGKLNEAYQIIKQTNWNEPYKQEAIIWKQYLDIKLSPQYQKSLVKEFIKTYYKNAKDSIYLTFLTASLLFNISLEKKDYKSSYLFLKTNLSKLASNKKFYIEALENFVKLSYLLKRFRDFKKRVEELLSLITSPSPPILEMIKGYAILNAIRLNRNTALKFFALFASYQKANTQYIFQPDFAEKNKLITLLATASEYSINPPLKNQLLPLIEKLCSNIEKTSRKEIENYLKEQKIIPKEVSELELANYVNNFKLLLETRCLGLQFRYTLNKSFLGKLETLYDRNPKSVQSLRELILLRFLLLINNIVEKEEWKTQYEALKKNLKDILALVRKNLNDKTYKEVLLITIYTYKTENREPEQVKNALQKNKAALAKKDTFPLYTLITKIK